MSELEANSLGDTKATGMAAELMLSNSRRVNGIQIHLSWTCSEILQKNLRFRDVNFPTRKEDAVTTIDRPITKPKMMNPTVNIEPLKGVNKPDSLTSKTNKLTSV